MQTLTTKPSLYKEEQNKEQIRLLESVNDLIIDKKKTIAILKAYVDAPHWSWGREMIDGCKSDAIQADVELEILLAEARQIKHRINF